MTIQLTPDLERRVHEKAEESGLDVNAFVEKVLREALGANGQGRSAGRRKPISEQFEEIRRNAPENVRKALNELPSDFAAEHDHYLYGAPKKYE